MQDFSHQQYYPSCALLGFCVLCGIYVSLFVEVLGFIYFSVLSIHNVLHVSYSYYGGYSCWLSFLLFAVVVNLQSDLPKRRVAFFERTTVTSVTSPQHLEFQKIHKTSEVFPAPQNSPGAFHCLMDIPAS